MQYYMKEIKNHFELLQKRCKLHSKRQGQSYKKSKKTKDNLKIRGFKNNFLQNLLENLVA